MIVELEADQPVTPQDTHQLEQQRITQSAVVRATTDELLPFVKCWPHLVCKKRQVQAREMERVVRNWARSKKLNVRLAIAVAEPFYADWREALLVKFRSEDVKEDHEMLTLPPEDPAGFLAALPTAVVPTDLPGVHISGLTLTLLQPKILGRLGVSVDEVMHIVSYLSVNNVLPNSICGLSVEKMNDLNQIINWNREEESDSEEEETSR